MVTYKLRHLFVVGALVAGAFAATAPRADSFEVRQGAVRYSTLDLTNSDDVRALYARIKTTAGKVCDSFDSPQSIAQQQRRRACIHAAVDRAVADIDAPLLNALHAQGRDVRLASVQ